MRTEQEVEDAIAALRSHGSLAAVDPGLVIQGLLLLLRLIRGRDVTPEFLEDMEREA